MSARKAAPFQPGQLLNWSAPSHWNYDGPQLCRYCGMDAFLLDSGRHPAHKVCAENALATQAAEAAEAYGAQTL
jgi:hypothetical protein